MTRILLSLSSMAPLIGIIALRVSDGSMIWAVSLGVVAVLSGLFLPLVMVARRSVEGRPMTVSSVKDESSQVPVYLLTYIFPFAFATIENTSAAVAYAVFALLLVVLLLRTDLSLVNPVLLAAGIHSYAVTTSTGAAVTLLARAAPLPGSHILATPLAGDAFHLSKIVEGDTIGRR